jgi:RNA polymerase sigma-70 factor (ECF subfamily)
MSLTAILTRCKDGDALAWEALVRQFQGRIYGMALHYTGNKEDARDLAQEVFVRIYQNIETCKPDIFVPWIIRIARNVCIDHLRRRRARPQGPSMDIKELADLPSHGSTPEQNWQESARKQLIRRALMELTGLNREIIILKEMQGLKLEEIAALLGVPLGTIKSRSNRARIELARSVLALTHE